MNLNKIHNQIVDLNENENVKYVRMFDVIHNICNNLTNIVLDDDILIRNYSNQKHFIIKSKQDWDTFTKSITPNPNVDLSWKHYVLSTAISILIHENIFDNAFNAIQRFSNIVSLNPLNLNLLKSVLFEQKSFTFKLTENLVYFEKCYSNQ